MSQRFDEAWRSAIKIVRTVVQEGHDVILVRDLLGRAAAVVVDTEQQPYPTAREAWLEEQLRSSCPPFVGPKPVQTTRSLFAPEAIVSAADIIILEERDLVAGTGRLALLERGIVGREWHRLATNPAKNRVALYGFKGGVGRSTATAVLSRYLASLGKCVLAIDLDLESPGMSAITLGVDETPDYGIVDYLVESTLNNVGDLDCVARSSRLRVPGNGEVWIAPAGGRPRANYDYLPKLNRAYLDSPEEPNPPPAQTEGVESLATFSARLRAAVDYCAGEVARRSRTPDVVLLDSRAGIHDVAAIAITQLSDLSLLFAVDNAQTWNGYRELFRQWNTDPVLTRAMRDRLKMVGAMVPATSEAAYLESFRDESQLLFSESLYDEAGAGDVDAFNPQPTDIDAPHSPLPILFSTDLVGVDVTRGIDWMDQDYVGAAFGQFVRGVASLLFEDAGDPR